MASEISKRKCAKCNKDTTGITMCYGCDQSLCMRHFSDHRQELSRQMNDVEQEYNVLQDVLIQEQILHPVMVYINLWEQQSIVIIKETAERARIDLQQIVDQNTNDSKEFIDRIGKDLKSRREADDYIESDIKKWMKQLEEFRQILDKLPIITIENDQTSIHLIKVNDSPTSHSHQDDDRIPQMTIVLTKEKFDAYLGKVTLSHDSLSARNLTEFDIACISGVGRYSSGIHHIHFRIEEMSVNKHFFFCIVTSLQKLTKDIWNSVSVHGWKDLGKSFEKVIQTGDEVTLTLDCSQQRIQLKHHRTNRSEDLQVNIHRCPFPWKIVIVLSEKDDQIRILY